MPAGDFSKAAIGLTVDVLVGTEYKEVTGLQDARIEKPNISSVQTPLLNGRSVMRAGARPVATLNGQMLANFQTDVHDVLSDAQGDRSVPVRVRTGPSETVIPTVSTDKISIAANTGICTFAPAVGQTDENSIFAALRNRQIAKGHCFDVEDKLYRIVKIDESNDDEITVEDAATRKAPTAAVADKEFDVVNPMWEVYANAHVLQIGNLTADTSGTPLSDSFSLGFIQTLPKFTPVV